MRDQHGGESGCVRSVYSTFRSKEDPLCKVCLISAQNQQADIVVVDLRKAYFNAIPERAIYMKLPTELGLSSDLVARQFRCVMAQETPASYGRIHTPKHWNSGFTTGMANQCVFYHRVQNMTMVLHGDDLRR